MLAPHLPGGWRQFAIKNLRVGESVLDFDYQQSEEEITLRVERRRGQDARELIFAPAVLPITQVTSVDINNRSIKFLVRPTTSDGHIHIRVPLGNEQATVRIRLRNSFALHNPVKLPLPGAKSWNLKIVSEIWSSRGLTMQVAGIPGQSYEIEVHGNAKIASAEGAELLEAAGARRLRIAFPPGGSGYVKKAVTLQFAAAAAAKE
jgi:hypothetical protein